MPSGSDDGAGALVIWMTRAAFVGQPGWFVYIDKRHFCHFCIRIRNLIINLKNVSLQYMLQTLFRNITLTLFKFNPDPTDLVTLFIQLFTADTQCSRTMKGVEYNPFIKAVVILWAISLDQLCY